MIATAGSDEKRALLRHLGVEAALNSRTLAFADGHTQNVVVPVTEAHVERLIPATGVVRDVDVNRDSAALARLDEQ